MSASGRKEMNAVLHISQGQDLQFDRHFCKHFFYFFFMVVDCGLVGHWDFSFLLLLFFNGGWSESIKARFLVLHVLLCIWYRQKKLSVLV